MPVARPFPLPVYGRCWRVHLLERAPCSRWPRRSCLATIGLRQAHVNRSNAASIRSASDRDSRCSTTTTLESCPGGTSASSRSVSVSARPSTGRKRRFRAIRTSAGVAISNTVYPLSVWLQQSRRPNHLTRRRFPVIQIYLDPWASVHFNSLDLENGNAAKGLSRGVGDGSGDWRLELEADFLFESLAYIRTPDGFVTSVFEAANRWDVDVYWVPFFNPGSNRDQVGKLRPVNPKNETASVAILGVDDRGDLAPSPTSTRRISRTETPEKDCPRASADLQAICDWSSRPIESSSSPRSSNAFVHARQPQPPIREHLRSTQSSPPRDTRTGSCRKRPPDARL